MAWKFPFFFQDSSNIQTIEQLVQNCLPNILDRAGHHTGGELMGPRERSTSNRDEAQKHRYVGDQYRVGGQSYGRVKYFLVLSSKMSKSDSKLPLPFPGANDIFSLSTSGK